ncbi:MAG: ABC transporter ATP-binding protein [Alphaproteobacteria bacterium]|nr:ABC transporter ATP-binding protein [Alphaproteobacteria bacterium]
MIDTSTNHAASYRPIGLSVRNGRLAWGETVLLKDFSFDVKPGSWTCLLGESGVGKSTLLRTIAGLIEPTGPTEILDHEGCALRDRVAYMAQQDLLLPWLSAIDNVMLGARLRGEAVDGDHARDILARTGVAERANARPAEMSGGERQRVALARTLMEECPIVLMDEPFSALDAITRTRLQDLAVNLLAHRTVLMVTHDPFEALRLADDVIILRGPVLDHVGSPNMPIVPPGTVPRDPTDPTLRDAHQAIMHALADPTVTEKTV